MAKYYLGCDLVGATMRAAIVDIDSGAVSFLQKTPTLGVAEAGELLLTPIRRTMRQHVFMMPIEKVQVAQAQLGNQAGVISTAWWAYERAELGYKIQ